MGIDNVLNTGCPTLWKLTDKQCKKIPQMKSKNVIVTITDYDKDYENDKILFDLVKKNYERVYVWIQGIHDYEYVSELTNLQDVIIIKRSIEDYTNCLKEGNIDYVGTRLHAGIHAMNLGIRSIIISIDNRAEEMAKDFNLPIIRRNQIKKQLEQQINSSFETKIELPLKNIEIWKNQFRKEL